MAELSTTADCLEAFYRLVGSDSSDTSLRENGEAADEVAYLYLTRGVRAGQRYLINLGMGERWLTTATLTFGAAAADGTRTATLPTDNVRLSGDRATSALSDAATGHPWGRMVDERTLRGAVGDLYALSADTVKVANGASLPTTTKLSYIARHAAIEVGVALDFPIDARWLIPTEAASAAKEEGWLPGGPEMETKIDRALFRAREEAKQIARRTRAPRQFRAPTRVGSRW